MYYPQKNSFTRAISFITLIAGILVMADRISRLNYLEVALPLFTFFKFNTALGLVFIGGGLLLTQLSEKISKPVVFTIIALLSALLGFAIVLEYLFHFNIGIDEFFIRDMFDHLRMVNYPGRLALDTATCICLFGVSYLLFVTQNSKAHRIGQYLLHIVISLSLISLLVHLYGLSQVNRFGYSHTMSAPAAVLFLCASIGASLLYPQYGVTGLFIGGKTGNLMARKLFLPLVAGILALSVFELEVQGLPPGITMFLRITLMLTIVWFTAKELNRLDEKRSVAENEVMALNTFLEKRAEQRSQALLKTFAKLEASEEKYRSLIEHASDAIYTRDMQGLFTEVNASMCKMTGYTREELLRMNVREIIDQEQLLVDPIASAPRDLTGVRIRERRCIKKNGERFDVEVNVKLLSENRILVIARDVSVRKQMETELRDAEEKFRTLAEKSMVGVYIVQKNNFVYVNPRFAKIFGYSPEELLHKPVETIISDDYKFVTLQHVQDRLSGKVESVHYEAIGHCKNGTNNWVEFYGNSVKTEGEPTIIGSVIDITERKKAEERLRLSEQKYKLLFDSNPLPMWMIAKDDQSIIAVNHAAAIKYGYTQDEFVKMNVRDIRLKDDWDKMVQSYSDESIASGDIGIVRHRKKDGTVIYVQIIAQEIYFEGRLVRLTLGNDITERIKSQERLQKSEANLQTILNTTDTAYALFDRDLNVLEFNQMAVKFVREQYQHEAKKGDKLIDYFPANRFPQFVEFTQYVLAGNDVSYEIDYPQPNGTVCWYYVRLFPIIDSAGQILGLMMALYDVTGRKNAENDLRMAYQQIRDQISNIKSMAWKQSHYIRSPIANLKGLTGMLKDDPANEKTLEYIVSELNRLDAVIVEMEKDASSYQNDPD